MWSIGLKGRIACGFGLLAIATALFGGAGLSDTNLRWKGGVIHYFLDVDGTKANNSLCNCDLECSSTLQGPSGYPFVAGEKENILKAIARYEAYTPITFVRESVPTIAGKKIVTFTKGNTSAHSGVGGQMSSKDTGCVYLKTGSTATPADTMLHEIGHATGMPHEQKRIDRDTYVHMSMTCVTTDNLHRFDPTPGFTFFGPYDYHSIMHYGGTSSCCTKGADCPAVCQSATGVCVKPPMQRICNASNPLYDPSLPCSPVIDDNDDFSPGDINTLYRMYERALGKNEAGDRFAATMLAGDFDGDGFLDLAVGAPNDKEHLGGAVFLYRGTTTRLVSWKVLRPAAAQATSNARFGAALAKGDLDGDGVDDLVVGGPGLKHDTTGSPASGSVYIYRVNSEKQLGDPARSARFGLSQRSVITGNGTVRDGDEFGAALAIGDFDGDGKMDLAIGAPGASRPSPVLQPRSGYVALYRGDSSAMVSPWSTLASTGLAQARVGDRFGAALAAGDLNGDGKADLAVGAPETASTKIGAVYVFVGGAPTLPGAAPLKGVQQLHAQTTGPAQVTALFGSALAVGRFEKGFGTASQLKTSLVVGAPYYGPDGEIQIYSTNGSGGASFQMTLAQTLTHPNPGDRLGSVLAAVRLGTDAGDTLIAGLPLRDRASLSDTGGYVMYTANKLGGAPPLLAPGTLLENPLPIAAPGDRFGSSIAVAGIYNALTGRPEGTRLVIGAEGRLAAGVFAVRLPTYWLPVHQEYVVKE